MLEALKDLGILLSNMVIMVAARNMHGHWVKDCPNIREG